MRLYPPITEEEARQWLLEQATARWGSEQAQELERMIRPLAEAMAAASAAELPEDVEPLWP